MSTDSPMRFNFNSNKSLAAVFFILDHLDGQTDIHKLFKIIYFADQKHLVNYGRPITGDVFVAMPNGHVPSAIYDLIKHLRGDNSFVKVDEEFKNKLGSLFEVVKHRFLVSKGKYDLDNLSESEIECLNESIAENKNLNFDELSNKSHDFAYEQAKKNYDNEVSFYDIAKSGKADHEMIKYIQINIENQNTGFRLKK